LLTLVVWNPKLREYQIPLEPDKVIDLSLGWGLANECLFNKKLEFI